MKCEICGKEIECSKYYGADLCSSECFGKHFWKEKVKNKNDKRVVIIDGKHYYIEDDNATDIHGFDGETFYIEFKDGRQVKTENLWTQGIIPDEFRPDLPDNAKFITKSKYKGE